LCRYLQWDLDNRPTTDGLLQWYIHTNSSNCRCGESGMDNSSRFDCDEVLSAVDFGSYAALECECVGAIATRLGKEEDAQRWTGERDRLNQGMNKMLWNDEAGIYMDCVTKTGRQTGILSSAGFLPLISGAPSEPQAERLARHLEDPKTFGTAMPVASIAPSQTEYYEKDMWRGPTWVNVNWLIARGFERYGLHNAAKKIRSANMEQIERWYEKRACLFEYYDTEGTDAPPKLLRKGVCNPDDPFRQVFHDYGWTASLYLDMVMSAE
jgi:neutral trehalase